MIGQTADRTKRSIKYRLPIQAIHLNLSEPDKSDYNLIYESVEYEFKRLMKNFKKSFVFLFIVTSVLSVLSIFYDYRLPFSLGLFIILGILISSLSYVFYGVLKNRPYSSKYQQSWKMFFERKGIMNFTPKTLYQLIRTYIKKYNPSTKHYIFQIFDRDYLIQLDEPINRDQRRDNFQVLNLLIEDLSLIEKLPPREKTRRDKFRLVNAFVVLIGLSFGLYGLLVIPLLEDGSSLDEKITIVVIYLQVLGIFAAMMNMRNRAMRYPSKEQIKQLLSDKNIVINSGEFFLELIEYTETNFPYSKIYKKFALNYGLATHNNVFDKLIIHVISKLRIGRAIRNYKIV